MRLACVCYALGMNSGREDPSRAIAVQNFQPWLMGSHLLTHHSKMWISRTYSYSKNKQQNT